MTGQRGFRRLLRIRPGQADVDQELQFHIDSRIEDLVRGGMAPGEARTRALLEFGDLPDTGRILRASRRRLLSRRARADWRSDLLLDTRIAWRGLLRRPALAAALRSGDRVAIAAGACGAIFTVVKAAYSAALPYPEPGRLLHLGESKADGSLSEASWPNFMDWRSQSNQSFTGLEGYYASNVVVGEAGDTRMLGAARVSSGSDRAGIPEWRRCAGRHQRRGAVPRLLAAALWRRPLRARPPHEHRRPAVHDHRRPAPRFLFRPGW